MLLHYSHFLIITNSNRESALLCLRHHIHYKQILKNSLNWIFSTNVSIHGLVHKIKIYILYTSNVTMIESVLLAEKKGLNGRNHLFALRV